MIPFPGAGLDSCEQIFAKTIRPIRHANCVTYELQLDPPAPELLSSQHGRCIDMNSEKAVILVVDDDASSRETLAGLLSQKGYLVASAENGCQALDYLRCSTPALILLDLMMPVMSGWEFLALRKTDPRLELLPVVVMTGSGLAHDIDAQAVLHKPIDFDLLMRTIEQNCSVL